MKIIFRQPDLATALSVVGRAAKPRPAQPVLSQVLVQAETGGQVTMTTCDLNRWIQADIAADVVRPGQALLPAQLLTQVIRTLPSGAIHLESSDRECRLVWDGGSCVMNVGHGEFPEPPAEPTQDFERERFNFSGPRWAEAVRRTAFAASNDETKMILTGIHCCPVDGGGIELAATNGHRLAICRLMNEEIQQGGGAPIPGGFTVPSQVMADLALLCAKETATIELLVTCSWVKISAGRYQVIVRLLDGLYPDYQKIVPTQFATEVVLDRPALVEALDRIGVVADKNNKTAQFAFANGQLRLTASAPDFASGEEVVPVEEHNGPELNISFNYRYLLDGLKQITSHRVQAQFGRAHDPALWIPIGEDPDFRYLVMPVYKP